jgi:hypothetical protein
VVCTTGRRVRTQHPARAKHWHQSAEIYDLEKVAPPDEGPGIMMGDESSQDRIEAGGIDGAADHQQRPSKRHRVFGWVQLGSPVRPL